ncbi:MAG: DUF2723 domain-containing protein, partial [Candidatus Omnitrophica bacterium]|nr:DUF2723 domain-containing protein [Candidatus Omnitrophota bacterium]
MKEFFEDSKKTKRLLFVGTLFLTFLIYLRTLCPTVYPGDGGELIAASYTLGIPHPPGYPLYCLLGKLFTFLPFGNVAYRLNLMSACFASLTVGFLFLVLLRFVRPLFAFTGSLFFAFLKDFWFHAVTAEVYTLNTFFFALLLYLLFRWEEERKEKLLLLSAFLFGLGLGNHHTLLIFGPLGLLTVALDEPRLLQNSRFLGKAILFLGLGLSVYLYLPLRAMSDPVANWGVSPSFKSVFYHLLRTQYQEVRSVPRSIPLYFHEIGSFFKTGLEEAPPLLWVFACFGFWKLLVKSPQRFFITAFLFLESSLLLILTINFEVTSANIALMRPFYLPAWMSLVLFWTLGLSEFFALLEKNVSWIKRGVVISLLLPLFLCLKNFSANDFSRHRLGEEFGRDLLDTVKPNGVLVVSGDDVHFAVAYLQFVEGLRPDVLVLGVQPSLYPSFSKKNFFKFLTGNPSRPIYTNGQSLFCPPGFAWKPTGLLYQRARKGETVSEVSWEKYRIREPFKVQKDDLFEKHLFSHYFWPKADAFLQEGKPQEALKLLEGLSQLAGREAFLQIQVGAYCISRNWSKEGFLAFQTAYRSTPYDPEVWKG